VADFVSDGLLRDFSAIADLPLAVFSWRPAAIANLALHHAVDMQIPIACAGESDYPR
jgi:regulator of RNase E activity RraA